MSAFIYLADLADLFRDPATLYGNALSVSSSVFAFDNLRTSDITKLWQSAEANGDPGYYEITIDLGSSRPWDFVAWINHDFPSTGAYRVKSGTTSGVLDYSSAITWREHDMYHRTPATRTDRYLSLGIQNDNDFQISAGRLLIGLSTVSPVPPTYGWDIRPITKHSDNRSSFNVPNVDVFARYKGLRFPFMSQIGNTAAATFIDFLAELQGPKHWFFLIPDSTEYDGYAVNLVSQPRRIRGRRNDFDDVEVEECARGVRITA